LVQKSVTAIQHPPCSQHLLRHTFLSTKLTITMMRELYEDDWWRFNGMYREVRRPFRRRSSFGARAAKHNDEGIILNTKSRFSQAHFLL
jgi:hypothetical protein